MAFSASGATTIKRGKASIKVTGLDPLILNILKLSPAVQKVAAGKMNKVLDTLFSKSQAMVPVDPEDGGQLKSSGRKNKARINKRGSVTGSVQYGGARLKRLAPDDNPLYAIAMHEDTGVRHITGSAKYLEKPTLLVKQSFMADMGRAIMEAANRLGVT